MPPTTLLEEYQYDDDQTADLLAAIRQWNLAPRSPECSHVSSADTTCTPTDASNKSPDFDFKLNGTSSMTLSGTEYDSFTVTSSAMSASKRGPRTPSLKSNFSSRPSGITGRLLLDTFQKGEQEEHQEIEQSQESNHNSQQQQQEGNQKTSQNVHNVRNDSEIMSRTPDKEQDVQSIRSIQSIQSLEENTCAQNVHDSNSLILLETAKTLGLESDQLHLVLPTVKKLVQVVTQHVPHLEHFVETVTDTVLNKNESDSKHMKSHKRRNMSARREEMNQVLNILTHDKKKCDGARISSSDGSSARACTQDARLKEKIQETLFKHPHLRKATELPTSAETPIKSNSYRSTSTDDVNYKKSKHEINAAEEEMMEEISRLIDFEERYSKVHGIRAAEESSEDDSTLQELLNADRTSLRRLVLHFAYLFSVKHHEALDKMNDLYVFSHEATSLIDDLKEALELPYNCSIHSVARKVLAELHSRKKETVL